MSTTFYEKVIAFAPASVANVGPCYDIMGYALDYLGDFVEIIVTDSPGQVEFLEPVGPYAERLALSKVSPEENSAYVVAQRVWDVHRESTNFEAINFGVQVKLHKYMPLESGMGSSAASGAAAAKAMLTLLNFTYNDLDLWNDLTLGEETTAGTAHPDNVIPSYHGGFHFMPHQFVHKYDTKDIPGLFSVVVKPVNQSLKTSVSREAVRAHIVNKFINREPNEGVTEILDAIKNQAALAAGMMRAVLEKKPDIIGSILHSNDLLEGARGMHINHFIDVKKAAIQAGAYGCTISGAGPAMVAICPENSAVAVRDAMIHAFEGECKWLMCAMSGLGARTINDLDEFIKIGSMHHNFF